jgi:hypothetical protein
MHIKLKSDLSYMWLLTFAGLLMALCGEAAAQFKSPPPDARAPVCSHRKSTTVECKDLRVPAHVEVSCYYHESGEWFSGMICNADAWRYSGGSWTLIDPSLLTYYWASIVDGEEYHSEPMESNTATVFCGMSRQGYVRVTAAGGTAITAFTCSGYSPPGGQ